MIILLPFPTHLFYLCARCPDSDVRAVSCIHVDYWAPLLNQSLTALLHDTFYLRIFLCLRQWETETRDTPTTPPPLG